MTTRPSPRPRRTLGGPPAGAVVLARPEVRNAFDDVLVKELQKIVRDLSGDEELRVVELSGEEAFCSGADLNAMKRMAGFTMEQNRRDAAELADLFRRLDEFRGRSSGACKRGAGGGVGLVAICDVVVAADDALFGRRRSARIVPVSSAPTSSGRSASRTPRMVPDGARYTPTSQAGRARPRRGGRRVSRAGRERNRRVAAPRGPQALAEASGSRRRLGA